MDERLEFVLIHDVVRDGPCGYPEVFILTGISERGDEVEIGRSMQKNPAPGVEMVLFMRRFVVVRSAVGVDVSPWLLTRLPPTVQRMR